MSARTGSNLKVLPVSGASHAPPLGKNASKIPLARAAMAKTIAEIQDRNRDLSEAEAQALADEAMASLDHNCYADRSWANAG